MTRSAISWAPSSGISLLGRRQYLGRFGFSDVMTAFLALDSYVELYKGGIVKMSEFVKMKRDNDILVRVIVKKCPGHFAYLSPPEHIGPIFRY